MGGVSGESGRFGGGRGGWIDGGAGEGVEEGRDEVDGMGGGGEEEEMAGGTGHGGILE